jgi:hypothetical protein
MSFQKELQSLLNTHCVENESDTPDFILAQYISRCLDNWNETTYQRDKWWNFKTWSHNEEVESTEVLGQLNVVPQQDRPNDSAR